MMKYIVVIGARPNFVKAAPLCKEFEERGIDYIIYHSGQHYNYNLSEIFEEGFHLSKKKIHHETRKQDNPIKNIEETIFSFRKFLQLPKFKDVNKPARVIVFGDVNTSLACALAAHKENHPIVHIEAGLRSFDIRMPEEHNRFVIDHISSWLFTTCFDADSNLLHEGIENHFMKGNLMIDTLVQFLPRAKSLDLKNTMAFKINEKKEIIAVTLHRPENVDNYRKFCEILTQLEDLSKQYNVVFPLHPRTRKRMSEFALLNRLRHFVVVEPLGYMDFLVLLLHSKAVITDSGGIQEETTYLKIPCFTVRENTERPITLSVGSNKLVKPQDISTAVVNIGREETHYGIPKYWDGLSANRIVNTLEGK